EGKSINDITSTLTSAKLDQVRQAMDECLVDLKLPRFTTEVEQSLNEVISTLGAPSIFTAKANFNHLANGNFFVSKMLQKAKIEVSEEGTKAAAVTAAIMTQILAHDEPRRVDFHADHPFVYVISEAQTGAILFVGQYTGE
ncbi:serine protease inhibitor family protein, partial [gut metagenome]